MRYQFLNNVLIISSLIATDLVFSQLSTSIKYLDKVYENQSFYYDLSFLRSNFSNSGSVKNRFSTRERNGVSSESDSCDKIKRIPSFIRIDLKLSYYYQKYTETYGIPIIGSNKVTVDGLKRACYVLKFYLATNEEIRKAFYKKNVRVVVLGASESILNIPEYDLLPPSWEFLRGLSPTRNIPLVTVSEDNLLCSNDKFKSEDLMVHQLSYGLLTLELLDAKIMMDLKNAYLTALDTVPWKKTFALIDIKEYLASAIDTYLGAFGKKTDFLFTLDDLKKYDPNVIEVIQTIFPCDNFYINKCKSSREIEIDHKIRLGNFCSTEKSVTRSIYALQTSHPLVIHTLSNNIKISRGLSSIEPSHVQTFPIINTSSSSKSTILSYIYTSASTSAKKSDNLDCTDTNENCKMWAVKGECIRNRQYMNLECKQSCDFCGEVTTTRIFKIQDSTKKFNISVYEKLCKDEYEHCPVFALRGDCKTNPFYMLQSCKRSCNLCGDLVNEKNRIHPTTKKHLIRRPLQRVTSNSVYYSSNTTLFSNISSINNQHYATNRIQETTRLKSDCQDSVHYCSQLAERGDCETNRNSMAYYCTRTCNMC